MYFSFLFSWSICFEPHCSKIMPHCKCLKVIFVHSRLLYEWARLWQVVFKPLLFGYALAGVIQLPSHKCSTNDIYSLQVHVWNDWSRYYSGLNIWFLCSATGVQSFVCSIISHILRQACSGLALSALPFLFRNESLVISCWHELRGIQREILSFSMTVGFSTSLRSSVRRTWTLATHPNNVRPD